MKSKDMFCVCVWRGGGGANTIAQPQSMHPKVTHATKNFKTSKSYILKINIKKVPCMHWWMTVCEYLKQQWMNIFSNVKSFVATGHLGSNFVVADVTGELSNRQSFGGAGGGGVGTEMITPDYRCHL